MGYHILLFMLQSALQALTLLFYSHTIYHVWCTNCCLITYKTRAKWVIQSTLNFSFSDQEGFRIQPLCVCVYFSTLTLSLSSCVERMQSSKLLENLSNSSRKTQHKQMIFHRFHYYICVVTNTLKIRIHKHISFQSINVANNHTNLLVVENLQMLDFDNNVSCQLVSEPLRPFCFSTLHGLKSREEKKLNSTPSKINHISPYFWADRAGHCYFPRVISTPCSSKF